MTLHDGKIKTMRYADDFVDDTTLWGNQTGNNTGTHQKDGKGITELPQNALMDKGSANLGKMFFGIMEWDSQASREPIQRAEHYYLQIKQTGYEMNKIRQITRDIEKWDKSLKLAPNGTNIREETANKLHR